MSERSTTLDVLYLQQKICSPIIVKTLPTVQNEPAISTAFKQSLPPVQMVGISEGDERVIYHR